ncbi:MAG: hypothetical protein JOZ64_12230 [Solirubrobacterales bacterium]|nr:hypothetical protein [Solirubrobacterales bacterium]
MRVSPIVVGLITGFHRRLHPYYVAVNLTVKEAALYGRGGIVVALNAIADDLTRARCGVRSVMVERLGWDEVVRRASEHPEHLGLPPAAGSRLHA